MKTGVRLVDGDRVLVLHPSSDYLPQALNVASPEVREVASNRTDDDGTRDTTMLFGARAVSLEIVVINETTHTEVLLDSLKRFLHPRSRPYLYVTDDGWAQERRIKLRVDQWDEPYAGYVASQARPVQLQWKAPDGIWEAATEVEETVVADVDTSGDGFSLPMTLPLTLTATQETGATLITNLGAVPSHFTARLYGPCTAPRLVNETTGAQIRFRSSLVLASGEYVEIDTRARTAYLLSSPTASRLTHVDFEATSWWQIEPGLNQIRYAPAPSQPGAAAVITYRPSWL